MPEAPLRMKLAKDLVVLVAWVVLLPVFWVAFRVRHAWERREARR